MLISSAVHTSHIVSIVGVAHIKSLLSSIIIVVFGAGALALADVGHSTKVGVLISGLQVSGSKEFVELANSSTESIEVTGWKLVYSNVSGSNVRTVAVLNGSILPGAHYLIASSAFIAEQTPPPAHQLMAYSGLADSGGSIKLYQSVASTVDPSGFSLVDSLFWSASEPLLNGSLLLTANKSLKRCTDAVGVYAWRDSTANDFVALNQPAILTLGPVCEDLKPVPLPDPVVESLNCSNLIISEVLPNPAGDDQTGEFIELYNPSVDSAELKGCTLEVSSSALKSYTFPTSLIVNALSYIVLYYSETSLTLPNSSPAEVRLVDTTKTEISATEYPKDLDDNESWSLIDGAFQTTYNSTAGLENIWLPLKPCSENYVRDPATLVCKKEIIETTETTCPEGSALNTETNRCNKIATISECRPGQERNPETNRCRTIQQTAVLTPCSPNQYRNPETNRCINVARLDVLEPCPVGKERNPETNRCRTIVLAASDAQVQNYVELAVPEQAPVVFRAGPLIIIASLGYMLYEWRVELGRWVRSNLRLRVR